MPRVLKYGPGRGTHMGRGVLSGSTVATIPSGVTLVPQGIQIGASDFLNTIELGYLSSAATRTLGYDRAGYWIETGIVDGLGRTNVAVLADASHTLSVNFSNITAGIAFFSGVEVAATASTVSRCNWQWSKAGADRAGVSIFCSGASGQFTADCISGSSIVWMAIGK